MARDYLRNIAGDLHIVNGDFAKGESDMQEVESIVLLNQGELKSDALMGCNLVRMMNANKKQVAIERVVRINLERDGKDYSAIKKEITLK